MREGTLAELYPTHMEAVTRIALLEIELEDAAELLQKAHPIGEVKGIGLREVATATKDICLELAALRERAGRLEEHWPQFHEGESGTDGVVDYTDGEWWVSIGPRVGGFATKKEAIDHYISTLSTPAPAGEAGE